MVLYCLVTLSGAYSLGLFRQFPADFVFILCALVGTALVRSRSFRPCACFLFGFSIMGWTVTEQLGDKLDSTLVGQDLSITALIEQFPVSAGVSMTLVVRPVNEPSLPQRVRLSWYEADSQPQIGESWRLTVRLKRPRGYSNPGGFDFEAWLFRERIGATGFVDSAGPNYRLHGAPAPRIATIRRGIVARLARVLPDDDANSILMAVTAGARHKITTEQWDLYARTGTSHLMAISGLHIGLAASFAYFVCWGVLSISGTRGNCRDISLMVAIVAAVVYAALSGFAVPAKRAALMTAAAAVFVLKRRQLSAATLASVAGLIVFVADPLAILTPGFQLSFSAVVVLIIFSGRFVNKGRTGRYKVASAVWFGCKLLATLQIVLLVALFPLTVGHFDRAAFVAPLINFFVLPVFNMISVPLALAGLVFTGPLTVLGDEILEWAYASVGFILKILDVEAVVPSLSQRTRELSIWLYLCAFLPVLFALLPPGWPGRRVSIVAIVAVLLHRPAAPPKDCLEYTVLDVGQGLSVVLRTANHAFVFDTGPKFRTGSDTGKLVILPFLHAQGIDQLERLIVSHADSDHSGGAQSLINAIPTRRILVGEPLLDIDARQTRCVAGIAWWVDGVSFSILHPRVRTPWARNNASCVLEVSIGEHRLLLSGDIEAPVEKLLHYRGSLRMSDVVVVPHHGSRTSSTESMVASTMPELAIVTTGFGNHWGFPKADIVARWENTGATVINTAIAGAVSQRLCRSMPADAYRLERPESIKYWHDVP